LSTFSKFFSSRINWDKADAEQKLNELAGLPPNDPILEQLALHEADPRVRHKAIERMEVAAQLRLVGTIGAADADCLAASLGERFDDSATASGDVVSHLISAPSAFRVALIQHAKSKALAIALTETLEQDSERAQVARGNAAIEARAAAILGMRDVDLLEAIAQDYRDKQRRIYRAARDRADQLLAEREMLRNALALCERLEGLLARHELTLSAFILVEREWTALLATSSSPSPTPDAEALTALKARYAELQAQSRALLQEQGETWRDAERLKATLAELAARSETDAAVEPDALAALVAERETAAAWLAQAASAVLPRERDHLAESIGKLTERHSILAIESKALVNARKLVEDLQADPAVLTPDWRADFARSAAIVRQALRAPIEEAAAAASAAIDAVTRRQIEAERAVEQQHRTEIEALVMQMEQLLDKGQHQQANETAEALKDKRAIAAGVAGARPLPAALEFRLKRCQERLAKMKELKRFGEVQAREALCREAESLAKRVARQEKSREAPEPADLPPGGAPDSPVQAVPPGEPEAVPAEAPTEAYTESPAEAPAEVPAEAAAPDQVASGPDIASSATPTAPDEPYLAPDALALAVRDLQTRWQKLDKGHSASSQGLWERFRRACDRAYAPAKSHFDVLEKQRSENAAKKNAVLEKIAALNQRITDGANWGKVLSERGDLVKAWFEAGALPRKNAREMQKRFDALTADIDAKLNARRAAERTRRRALIEQAKAIAEKPADGNSMAAMIALQKQWQEGMKHAIRLKPREDQSMWEEFRAAGSALFGKRDAEKAARNAERDVQLAERRALIDELQALAAGSDVAAIKRGSDELGARWHAMPWPDRKPLREWEQKFAGARAAASARIAAIHGEAENRKRAAVAAQLAVVERAEQALGNGTTPDIDSVRAELQAMLAADEKPDAKVAARLAALEAAAKLGPDAWRAQAQKTQGERDALLLELEIVLGLPSPPELEAARRMRMLKRLAESKNSRATPPLMPPDAPKAVEKLLALPLAMQGVQERVEAVIEASRRKTK
jgi:hypothetical protein